MPHEVCDGNGVGWAWNRARWLCPAGFMSRDRAGHSVPTNSAKGRCCLLIKKQEVLGLLGRGGLGFHACGCCGPSGFPVAHQPRALGVDLVTADKRPCGSRRFWSLFQETRWVLIDAETAHSLPLFIPDWQPESHVGYSQGAYPRKLPCAFIARAA